MARHFQVSHLRTQGHVDIGLDADELETQPKLRRFMAELITRMPWLKFMTKGGCEVYAYTDTCPYALGYIGYADYSGGSKYMVYSRTITNNKFNSSSLYHNMLMSNNIATATRNARTHLRSYSTAELATQSAAGLCEALTMASSGLREQLRVAKATVMDLPALLAELRVLVEKGHTFVQPDFATAVQQLIECTDQTEVTMKQILHYTYVHISQDWRGQVFNMQAMQPCKSVYTTALRPDTGQPSVELPVAEVDPTILGRVSVLSLLTDKTYVAGVGMRIAEDSFYVQV